MELKRVDLHTIENIARTTWIQNVDTELSDAELKAFAWTKAVLSVLTRYGYPDIEITIKEQNNGKASA